MTDKMEITSSELNKDIKSKKEALARLRNSYNLVTEAIAKLQGQIDLLYEMQEKIEQNKNV